MRKIFSISILSAALMTSACSMWTPGPAGTLPQSELFGEAVNQNMMAQIAYGEGRLRNLAAAFKAETDDTVTFAFNSAKLDSTARAAVDTQIAWLKKHDGVRMSVTGHADAVGGEGYNYRLGLRRARAVVNYMVSRGISRKRLDELVSKGETDPVIDTDQRERRNRRVVTTVAGLDRQFVGFGMDGRKARAAYGKYIGQ